MIAWICLVAATLLVLYVLIGYPALLAVWWKRGAPPVGKDRAHTPSVSVIMAVHNGENFIAAKLDTLFGLDYPPELLEILVVSDGSTDQTEAIVRKVSDPRLKLLTIARGGKAAALNHAIPQAKGDILFFTDVRQPLDRNALRHLAGNFADPTVGAVTGELQMLKDGTNEQVAMDLYWRYELWSRTRHSMIDSLYTATGCIYAMRRDLAGPIPPDTLCDDVVLPLRAFFRGYRVIFDPEAIAYDYPVRAGSEFRRRFRTLAGMYQVHAWFPQLFTSQNRMRLHFLSHKFLRLVLPWALVVICVATLWLPSPEWRNLLLLGEGAMLVLAVSDWVMPRGIPLKRITSPLRTFLIMNVAAMAAIAVFFIPATRLWRPTQVQSPTPDSNH